MQWLLLTEQEWTWANAIHRVAADTTAACRAELELFRELLGPDVVRETHIATGDRCCTYRIGGASA